MKQHNWLGQPIIDPEHVNDLEQDAAIHEFQHGIPREEAEKKAYSSYTVKHHKEAAAHHLRGLRAALASGDDSEAQKHGTVYAMHLKAAGLNPFDPIPDEIKDLAESGKRHTKFSAHKADTFLIHGKT